MSTKTEIPEVAAMPRVRPEGYKKRHKFMPLWRAWCGFVTFIYERWPRND